jgi:hypothetical protein
MRIELIGAMLFAVLAPGLLTAGEPEKSTVELRCDSLVSALPLIEDAECVYGIRLTAQVDENGEGDGTLELDPNAPAYDEFGFQATGSDLPLVKLECTLKLVKKKKIQLPEHLGVAAPLVDVEWVLIEIQGPRITRPLFLATETNVWSWARLLVHDENGKVKYVVPVRSPPPPPPCHPGCFPAGTRIDVPGGTKAIESLRTGDAVTAVDPNGASKPAKVVAVFSTKNRLVEVRTEAGNLLTTETQPLALAGGGLRPAGELTAGDRIQTWNGGEARTVAVRSVAVTHREAQVFNLVLGDTAIFVAEGFLVRSKLPAPASDLTEPQLRQRAPQPHSDHTIEELQR